MVAGQFCTKHVVTADSDETIVEVAQRMRDSHVGAVVVADSQKRPIGLLTDRDIVVSVVAQSPDKVDTLLARDVMSRDVVTIRAAEPIDAALRAMQQHGIRRLPVVGADGRLEGILTLDDILEVVSGELAGLIGLVALEQKRERVTRPVVAPAAAVAR